MYIRATTRYSWLYRVLGLTISASLLLASNVFWSMTDVTVFETLSRLMHRVRTYIVIYYLMRAMPCMGQQLEMLRMR